MNVFAFFTTQNYRTAIAKTIPINRCFLKYLKVGILLPCSVFSPNTTYKLAYFAKNYKNFQLVSPSIYSRHVWQHLLTRGLLEFVLIESLFFDTNIVCEETVAYNIPYTRIVVYKKVSGNK